MGTDKDQPWTWVRYKSSMCASCHGSCCTMPVEVQVEDLQGLGLVTEDEAASSLKQIAKKLIKAKIVVSYRESTGLFMLNSRPNGDCVFLNEKNRLCTVYEKRPGVCRSFPEVGPKIGYCPYRKK